VLKCGSAVCGVWQKGVGSAVWWRVAQAPPRSHQSGLVAVLGSRLGSRSFANACRPACGGARTEGREQAVV